MHNTDALLFIGHNCKGGIDALTIEFIRDTGFSLVNAMCSDEVVDLGHINDPV